jgi:hypothetical protein
LDAPEGERHDAEHRDDSGRLTGPCPCEESCAHNDKDGVEPSGTLVDVREQVVDQFIEIVARPLAPTRVSTSGDALKTTMTRADALVMGWAVRDSNP